MEISDVKHWLSGKKDFTAGVALYRKFGTNDYLKDLFSEEDDYNREKLEDELRKVADQQPAAPDPLKVEPRTNVSISDPDFYLLPGPVQQWKKEANLKFRENSHRQKCLEGIKEKYDRAELAHHILMVDDELETLYSKINYYEIHKKLPPAEAVFDAGEMTVIEMKEEIQRLSVQISKQKNNSARAADVSSWILKKEFLTRAMNELI